MPANDKQVGGSHYRSSYQHWDLVTACGNRYLEGQATKYLSRYKKKNGLEDLQKAVHYTEKLLEEATAGNVRPPVISHAARYDEETQNFCALNGIDGEAREAMILLMAWSEVHHIGRAGWLINLVMREYAGPDTDGGAPD